MLVQFLDDTLNLLKLTAIVFQSIRTEGGAHTNLLQQCRTATDEMHFSYSVHL